MSGEGYFSQCAPESSLTKSLARNKICDGFFKEHVCEVRILTAFATGHVCSSFGESEALLVL